MPLTTAAVVPFGLKPAAANGYKAVALDAFTILDPRPINTRAEELFPRKGAALADRWRTRQFEYTWLRTLTRTYVDFQQVTEESLIYAAKSLGLDLSNERKQRLLRCYWEFQAWPDAYSELRRLKTAGLRLVFLSNFTEQMLDSAVNRCGLQGLFEPHLSTDKVRAFKPDPRAYRMAVDALGLRPSEIVFAAYGGWDATGAKAFGFPTLWVNRMSMLPEELGIGPDAIGSNLSDLTRFVIGSPSQAARAEVAVDD